VIAERVIMRTDFVRLAPDAPAGVVSAELVYDSRDPAAVTVTFSTGRGPVSWLVGRELLSDGLERPAGLADVQVRPAGADRVALELRSPSGHATVAIDRIDLVDYLAEVYAVVPHGREWDVGDVDAELVALIEQDRAA
jgi:hypothetical protein